MEAVHPGTTPASFELERLEVEDGRLVVMGWWFGVRGMRFVRPALVVEGRKVLATLEYKPWAVRADGSWIASFPWKDDAPVDGGAVTLVVAPSVEVPLDREAAAAPRPGSRPAIVALAPPSEPPAAGAQPLPPEACTVERSSHRDELQALERRLDDRREELHEARATAAEREARCRDLEQVAASARRAAEDAGSSSEDIVRAHAIAVLDRDRTLAQLQEAVVDREAAVRTRTRMETQRDEAVVHRDAAYAQREEVIAERDVARRQRDEVVLSHRALQDKLNRSYRTDEPAQPLSIAPAVARAAPQPVAAHRAAPTQPDAPTQPVAPTQPDAPTQPVAPVAARDDRPSGVRVVPAARAVGAHLHRRQRQRDGGVTKYDMWAIRILGSVAALAFISLLVMILKAFFVF